MIANDNGQHTEFKFSESFLSVLDATLKSYDKEIDKLSSMKSVLVNNPVDYGVCNCAYKMRYITPTDISVYVSNLSKFMTRCVVEACMCNQDVEMFTVASVKRFIEEHKCVSFESSSIAGTGYYANPKTTTLSDLLLLCENDTFNRCVYSKYELMKRLDDMKTDIAVMENMHLVATIRNLTNGIPKIISNSDEWKMMGPDSRELFTVYLETFVLFVCCMNELTVRSMIEYAEPKTSYSVVEHNYDIVTECCFIKTNDFIIRNRIPFNCNIRDVVLQDVHPTFKDTESALHYIVNGSHSPIAKLLNQYSTVKPFVCDTDAIVNMFVGFEERHAGGLEKMYSDVDFHTDVNWLDKIAYGNSFLDGNYRNDTNGNHHMNPIRNTLSMIYRMFSVIDAKSNEELANNILRVYNNMKSIIHHYEMNRVENYQLIKDILCVMGEIMTRNIIQLYNNNNSYVSYSDSMDDTMAPGYLYSESYIVMEADGKNADGSAKPTVSMPGEQQPTGNFANVRNKISNVVKRFIDWITKTLGQYGPNFMKNHAAEIKWVNANKELNNKIYASLGKTFRPSINNYHDFKIQSKLLTNINVDAVVKKWLDSKDPIDPITLKTELYPGDDNTRRQIANMKNDADEAAALTNVILYGNVTPNRPYSGELRPEQWKEIVEDISSTEKLVNVSAKAVADSLKKACENLKSQMDNNKTVGQNQDSNADNPSERAEQIFSIVQSVSQTYVTTVFNALNKNFYGVNYTLYREIVKLYKQQTKNQNTSNAQNMNQTQQQPQQSQSQTQPATPATN